MSLKFNFFSPPIFLGVTLRIAPSPLEVLIVVIPGVE